LEFKYWQDLATLKKGLTGERGGGRGFIDMQLLLRESTGNEFVSQKRLFSKIGRKFKNNNFKHTDVFKELK
jgi:hypothetical protein